MDMLTAFGMAFAITMGVETALGLSIAIGTIFKGANKK